MNTDLEVISFDFHPGEPMSERVIDLVNDHVFDWPDRRNVVTALVESEPQLFGVLSDEDKVVAAGSLTQMPNSGCDIQVHTLVVDPEYRGRGYGQLLLDHMEHEARGIGSTGLWLTVKTPDLDLFYRKRGYEPSPYEPNTMLKYLR